MFILMKTLIDAILGGTMDKMLKNNTAMTGLSVILLCFGVWFGYVNHQDIMTLNTKFDHVQAALHYKLNIDTEQPYGNNDSSKAPMHRDAMLANNKMTAVQKEQ